MSDVLTQEQRRRNMQAIRSGDTRPEIAVRRLLHRMGYRFRLHRRDLPGKPDIVLPRLHRVILVHGCFWHQHPRCRFASRPATRPEFWSAKFGANRKRDQQVSRRLRSLGWKVLVVWECQTRAPNTLETRLRAFLSEP